MSSICRERSWRVSRYGKQPRWQRIPEPSNRRGRCPTDRKRPCGRPTREVLMLTVEYLPGGASLPHRHDAQVFVYVLQGELRMQVAGAPR